MKNLVLIVSFTVLTALGGSTLFAQRSNSAVQTVTFGVSRSPLASINPVPLAQNNLGSNSITVPTTRSVQFETLPLKITYSNGSVKYIESRLSNSSEDLIAASLSSVSGKAIPQAGLRYSLKSRESSSSNTPPLVVTITE